MHAVARSYGMECGFVLPAPAGSGCDFAFGLLLGGSTTLDAGTTLHVRQRQAMKRPSLMTVRFRRSGDTISGCWLGGGVRPY
jgi:predicted PhzF superfamily epimerase YddE/YHI9